MPADAFSQDFVYTPKNPAFGGSYLNYSWLLSSANAQNLYEGGSGYRYNRDPLANFQESLQRQVLSDLTRNLIRDRFGEIDLSEQNSFDFGEFSIDIVPGPNGIEINISNLATGDQTTITIPNF
jgi:curli production assembly/transport component CsgF